MMILTYGGPDPFLVWSHTLYINARHH